MELNYRDVLLQPKPSVLDSRSEADTSVSLISNRKQFIFDLPIIPANMKTIINEDLAVWFAKNNIFYCMHRFNTDIIKFCENMIINGLYTSISLGVNQDSYDVVDGLYKKNITPDFITIDIAHGACEKMKKMVSYVRKHFPETCLIVGNVCTVETTKYLCELEVDAVKIGIGPGCFIKGSKVLTNKGLVDIDKVEKGYKVLTHKNRFKKVTNIMSRLEEDRVIVLNNKITSTSNHEYYVLNNKYLTLVNDDNINEYAEWISAEKLNKKYLLIKNKGDNWFELIEIESIEEKDFNGVVYDLEVEDDSSYNIEGVIVHNSVCTTKLKTGFSRPQFSAVKECATVCDEYGKISIADGGIEHNGDIAKAIVAGADLVMVGSILAGFEESPGENIVQIENGREIHYKEFYGSASEHNKKEKKNVEGKRILIPLKGSIKDKIGEIKQDIQSSISYAGGKDLKSLFNIDYVVVH